MCFLVEVKRSLVRAREFDEKGYLEYNVTIPIRMTVVNITLTHHYLGQYVKNVFRKS
ncbi:unnamed protein product [marine sediment metagenome]|uniref:Uncharacterized protein n=1 Tax=marine sediment metagenome TaxID=412755 RepID=X1SCX0_9ZZZZ